MKKYFFVSALAALLVFAFAAVAGAKYAGYAVDGSLSAPGAAASSTPGYLSWGGAAKLMASNGVSSTLASTAHGGYVTTTTKCAVCHSVHRATGAGSAVGVVSNQFLTSGSGSCVQCHTAWGSTQAALLVEWAGPETPQGGPHSSSGCANCHLGGVHGTSTSQYWGMNAFMLGGANDAQIAAELPLLAARHTAAVPSGTNAGANLINADTPDGSGTGTGVDWFVNGSSTVSETGGVPAQIASLDGGTTLNANSASQWAMARSALTGFTCGQPGCHVNSVFANDVWGQTYARRLGATSGSDTTSPMMMATGHSTAPGADQDNHNSGQTASGIGGGTGGNACGPCHPGNAAGGYRLTSGEPTARAYGCDQCHDAVGQATNSTAFPHGNRNIAIYQWANGTAGNSAYSDPSTIIASSGNIWMYAANMSAAGTTESDSATQFPTSLVDPSVTLMQGTVGPNAAGDPGNIMDAVCLKCHVPADATTANYWATSKNLTLQIPNTLIVGAPHHGMTDPYFNMPSDFAPGLSLSDVNPYNGSIGGASQTALNDRLNAEAGTTGTNYATRHKSNALLYLWR